MSWLNKLWNDDAGVIISAELVLILTIVVIGVLVGLVAVRDAVIGEFHDIGLAFSHLNQSYGYSGFAGCLKWNGAGHTSFVAGSSFIDLYDGTNVLTVGDFGSYSGGVYLGGFGMTHLSRYGCIVLADGTLIPLTWVASGTWSCPGGIVLAATSANATTLRLADGTLIPFLLGRGGTIVYSDGRVAVVRPGVNGTLVLSDGTIAVIDINDAAVAVLPDGTRVTFQPLDANVVLLTDGTTLAARAGESGTLVLTDGRVVRLHTAIAFSSTAIGVGSFGTITLADGTMIPLTFTQAGVWTVAGGLVLKTPAVNALAVFADDGAVIPFALGRPGTITYADGRVAVVRLAGGQLILADGTIARISAQDGTIATLADGARVTFRVLESDWVLLSNGKMVKVESAVQSTLTLDGGLVIDLHRAILIPSVEPAPAMMPGCPGADPCYSVPAATLPAVPLVPTPEPKPAPEPTKKKKPSKSKKTVMLWQPEPSLYG